jgi:MerR family transcriptional regulator, thiopeptide resistance regulator
MRRAQDEWAALIADVEAERVAGTDPADPRLDPLVARWTALIEQFTGGDPGIRASLQQLYDTEGRERASHGAMHAETMAYAGKAMAARGAHPA